MDENYLTRKATDTSDITGVRPIKTRTDTCDIPKFEKTVWLSSPTMHGDELKYMTEAYEQNWMSTVGANIDEVERLACEQTGCKYAVAFGAFRLYGGLWRYAGINDMNRIILASLCTALLHVLGTTIFYTRMPVTYYLIGAVLQFGFVVVIRFAYRVLLVEKKRLRRGQKVRCLVVGSGENGRRVVKHLEEEGTFEPVAIYSSSTHSSSSSSLMDGIPVVGELKLENVGAVFIADPLITTEERARIRKAADAAGADVQDYTGFFSNLGGRLSLTELLSTIHGPFSVVIDGKSREYDSGEQALQELNEKYVVKEIEGQTMKLKLERQQPTTTQDALKAAYAAVMGDDPPHGRA